MGHQASQRANEMAEIRGYSSGIADGSFQHGAIYGVAAGIASVMGAYFLLKMYKRNKMSDDFERA